MSQPFCLGFTCSDLMMYMLHKAKHFDCKTFQNQNIVTRYSAATLLTRAAEEAHGPYRSPEKRFQSIYTFLKCYHNDYTCTIILIKKKPHYLQFEITWIPFIKGCFRTVAVEKISKFRQCIFTILLLSPLGKGYGPTFEETWIPFTQGCFVPSFGPVFLERKIFKFS